MSEKSKPHSEEYFTEQRDYWWNQDFLEGVAKRLHFDDARLVLDAGCGVGHWGQLLAPLLHPNCEVIGIDRETAWVQKASERAQRLGLQNRYHYQQADVNALPFPDNHFDLVTCQTVLIHVADPQAVINEFTRVLKPGGLLLAAEPNNMVANLVVDNTSKQSVDDIAEMIRFRLYCEKGKETLGKGNNSIGDLVPGYFAQSGLIDITVRLSDKVSPLIPPYDTPEQQALIAQFKAWYEEGNAAWNKDELLEHHRAGGGNDADFERYWVKQQSNTELFQAGIARKILHSAGGVMTYVVSGRKSNHS